VSDKDNGFVTAANDVGHVFGPACKRETFKRRCILAQTREVRCDDAMAQPAEFETDRLPAPRTVPRAMDEYESGHQVVPGLRSGEQAVKELNATNRLSV